MSVTSTLLLRGLARGKARFACAALGVAAAAGAVVFVFSLAASNAAQAPSLARRAATPWAAWRFEGMPAGPWGAGAPRASRDQVQPETPHPLQQGQATCQIDQGRPRHGYPFQER